MKQAQNSTATSRSRHDFEFGLIAKKLNKDDIKILSFGCSEGFEVEALRKFFPKAIIHGCDINEAALDVARKNFPNEYFFKSEKDAIAKNGPYDLIVCCSVLCVHPANVIEGKVTGLGFDIWQEIVGLIDKGLYVGGILLLINSQFPFRFYQGYDNFTVVNDPYFSVSNFVNLFTPSGLAATGMTSSSYLYNSSSFPFYIAESNSIELQPKDFHEICFQKNGSDMIDRFSEVLNFPDDAIFGSFETKSNFLITDFGRRYSHKKISYVNTILKCNLYENVAFFERVFNRHWFDGTVSWTSSATFKVDKVSAFNLLKIHKYLK
jgi:hypothetical protein